MREIVSPLSGITSPFRQRRWTTSDLFAGGKQGAWYDPSDLSTLFQDAAGTSPVTAPGDPVGLMLDKSGNGRHASQPTASKRPTYGIVPKTGRRNLLYDTEGVVTGWAKTQTVVAPNGFSIGGIPSFRVTFQAGKNLLSQPGHIAISNKTTLSAILRKGDIESTSAFKFGMYDNTTVADIGFVQPDLTSGVIAASLGSVISHSLTPVSGEVDTFRLTVTLSTTPGNSTRAYFGAVGGDSGTGYYDMAGFQLEAGSVATPYQRVGSDFDVTETGVPSLSYLYKDPIDDSLIATLPDLGTNATVAYATEAGVTNLTGQTIGAGVYEMLAGEYTYGHIVVDRALTPDETVNVTKYLTARIPT